ncbi:MAG: hypothetical protein HRU09_13785 [Oligoflexales bacterium]|nr:hypothetical protein [Oligoflexales bacterium]
MLLSTYYLILCGVTFQRLAELKKSERNAKVLVNDFGAKEYGKSQLLFMKALHSLWLVGCFLEPMIFKRSWDSSLFPMVFIVLFILGQSIRLLAIKTLGIQWNIRILVANHLPRVKSGIYQYLNHPNYVGVAIELLALPMIVKCYYTATFASLANLILMMFRITQENRALNQKQAFN